MRCKKTNFLSFYEKTYGEHFSTLESHKKSAGLTGERIGTLTMKTAHFY